MAFLLSIDRTKVYRSIIHHSIKLKWITIFYIWLISSISVSMMVLLTCSKQPRLQQKLRNIYKQMYMLLGKYFVSINRELI